MERTDEPSPARGCRGSRRARAGQVDRGLPAGHARVGGLRGPHRHASLVGKPTRRVWGVVRDRQASRSPRGHDDAGGTNPVRPSVRRSAEARWRRPRAPTRETAEMLETRATASRLLADRLIAGLDNRPFCPTPDQLALVWGGDLVRGETRASRARIAGGRYAALLADYVVGDVTVDAAPGAYVRIWLCARLAFIASTTSEPAGSGLDGALGAWEYEGGARAKRVEGRRATTARPNFRDDASSFGRRPHRPRSTEALAAEWPVSGEPRSLRACRLLRRARRQPSELTGAERCRR